MFFSISLYAALMVFGIGLLFKVLSWFRYGIGDDARRFSSFQRIAAVFQSIMSTLFSVKLFSLLRILVVDVLFQMKTLKENFPRWFMHMFIFGGFMLLLLMHALDKYVTASLFGNYVSTLNPFFFLRNLFGAMVIVGVAVAIYRRLAIRGIRLTTRPMDSYTLVILAVIMASGILLEAAKIVSYTKYYEMVDEYGYLQDEQDKRALEAYWSKEFGVVFPGAKHPADVSVLEAGKNVHEANCVSCHVKPQWAFMSYGVARAMGPVAVSLTEARIDIFLWYVHFLACFIGLAYLPFSKFFHILASPLSLLANGVMEKETANPATAATKQIMELDACTHCGVCSLHCSVGVMFRHIQNMNILPSEKLASLKAIAAGKELSPHELRIIQEGCHLCTGCYRCTKVCPVGINLQDLWSSMQEDLAQKGYPEFFISVREAIISESEEKIKDRSAALTPGVDGFRSELSLSIQGSTFFSCYECQTCTNACPVVRNYEKPVEVLGMLPHQIIHSLKLGLREITLGSRMVWDCVGCYMCQEHCPQGVQVADIIYELKNKAYRLLKESENEHS